MLSQLTDEIWWMQLGPRAPLQQNVFLVDDAGTLTLIDAGLPWNASTIRRYITDAGFEMADVDRVLVTHYDLDHVGGLHRLAPQFDFAVYMGGPDLRLAQRTEDPPLVHHKGAFHRILRRIYPLPDDHVNFLPLEDAQAVGGFTAYHTPGHNPGHTAYVHDDLSAAFLGDLVWEDGGRLTTPILLDSYDMTELGESVRDLADRVTPFDLVAMGHGTPLTTGGYDALRALADTLA